MNNTIKEIFLIATTVVLFLFIGKGLIEVDFMNGLSNATVVFDGLGWFIGLFIIASLFTAYLVIVARIHFVLRFLAIPIWLIFTLSTIVTIDQFLGHAYPIVPPKAQILSYRVFLQDGKKKIEAWLYPKEENGRSRLYVFDWSEENEQKLKKGKRSTSEGVPMEIELREGGQDDRPLGKLQGEDQNYGIKYPGLPPKEEVERR